jgi:Holliday junction resolvasome RuvABC endonuclease subunit
MSAFTQSPAPAGVVSHTELTLFGAEEARPEQDTTTAPRIIGLDLSIAGTGIADMDGVTSTLKLKAALGDQRLDIIARAVNVATMAAFPWRAELAVIEDLPTHAHGAGITGMVHGAVRTELIRLGVRYVTVPPASLKKFATGKGNSDKVGMALAALKRLGAEFADDNQCDAAWLRVMGLAAYGRCPVELPQAQTAALSVIEWPQLGGA